MSSAGEEEWDDSGGNEWMNQIQDGVGLLVPAQISWP